MHATGASWSLLTVLRGAHSAARTVRPMPICICAILEHAVVTDLAMRGAVEEGDLRAGLCPKVGGEGRGGEVRVAQVAVVDVDAGVAHADHHVLPLQVSMAVQR